MTAHPNWASLAKDAAWLVVLGASLYAVFWLLLNGYPQEGCVLLGAHITVSAYRMWYLIRRDLERSYGR